MANTSSVICAAKSDCFKKLHLDMYGYRDSKKEVIGKNNPINVVYAIIEALNNMNTIQEDARKRGKKVSEIL